jgi:hypothetical protein
MMRSRISILTATLVLAVCLAGQVAEVFDQWDHTLQTGNDTEYTLVVLALCVGVAYSLKWFIPRVGLPDFPTAARSFPRRRPIFSALNRLPSIVAVHGSPPAAALRI